MVVQLLDLLLHSGLLGLEPPPDIPPPLVFQLKINPRLNEGHAVPRLDHAFHAASHVLPIGATYPPPKEILRILLVLELALWRLPSFGPKPDVARNRLRSWNQACDFHCPARAAHLEAHALIWCDELSFIPCKIDFFQFLSQLRGPFLKYPLAESVNFSKTRRVDAHLLDVVGSVFKNFEQLRS